MLIVLFKQAVSNQGISSKKLDQERNAEFYYLLSPQNIHRIKQPDVIVWTKTTW